MEWHEQCICLLFGVALIWLSLLCFVDLEVRESVSVFVLAYFVMLG